jgi:hypothetical protein
MAGAEPAFDGVRAWAPYFVGSWAILTRIACKLSLKLEGTRYIEAGFGAEKAQPFGALQMQGRFVGQSSFLQPSCINQSSNAETLIVSPPPRVELPKPFSRWSVRGEQLWTDRHAITRTPLSIIRADAPSRGNGACTRRPQRRRAWKCGRDGGGEQPKSDDTFRANWSGDVSDLAWATFKRRARPNAWTWAAVRLRRWRTNRRSNRIAACAYQRATCPIRRPAYAALGREYDKSGCGQRSG